MRSFAMIVTTMVALGTVNCLNIPETTSPGSIATIFGRTPTKCSARSKDCYVGICPKMKTVLQSRPPAPCPLRNNKRTTKTQRAVEIASNLLNHAANKGAKPKRPVSPVCSLTPTPAPNMTTKPKKPTKPTKSKPCTGKKCKRVNLEQDLTLNKSNLEGGNSGFYSSVLQKIKRAVSNLIERAPPKRVAMDEAKVYSWGPNDAIETTGISVCSVLIVYTKSKVGMAHIPQGRIVGNRYMPGEDVVNDLTTRLGTAFGSMSDATAVLYHHPSLDEDRVKQISAWIRAQGATPKIEVFGTTIVGSGVFTVQRFGDAWPPYHSPPL